MHGDNEAINEVPDENETELDAGVINEEKTKTLGDADTQTKSARATKKYSSAPYPKVLDVDQIIHFEPETDFITKTQSTTPYVIISPKGNLVIDGANLIENAKKDGVRKITVLAECWKEHSDYRIAVKKFVLRNSVNREPVYYIENMKHIANIKCKCLQDKSVIEFSVGGNRKDLDRSSVLNDILVRETDLDSETIGKYLTDIRYINTPAIDRFIEYQKKEKKDIGKYPNKDYFEMIRPKKIDFIVECESDQLEYEEIENCVSLKVLDAYEKYRKGEHIEAFSDKLESAHNAIQESAEELLADILARPISSNRETEKVSEVKTAATAECDNDAIIRNLAERLWGIANDQETGFSKKGAYCEIVNELLRIIGRI